VLGTSAKELPLVGLGALTASREYREALGWKAHRLNGSFFYQYQYATT
jgi:hypothetical protein